MTYSFIDLINEVLKTSERPLSYQEIWDRAEETGLTAKLKTQGKTPAMSLGSRLYFDVKSDPEGSRYVKVGSRPAKFYLKDREKQINLDEGKGAGQTPRVSKDKSTYKERDLHPLMAKFAFTNIVFNRGKAIFTKTIHHEVSKKGYSEWTNPDMVGFYLPIADWSPEVLQLNKATDNNSVRMYSFELKISVDRANYRESFFQAVSNSSWAHEGYLVAVNVPQDDDLLAELERLCTSFGIGLIQLDLEDFDSSSVIFPARQKELLDWETINKLAEQNEEFKKFIDCVSFSFNSGRIIPTDYDDTRFDLPDYIEKKLGVKPRMN